MERTEGFRCPYDEVAVNLNRVAAEWLAVRFGNAAMRDAFRNALMDRLPDGDWYAYNDYDPSKGPMLDAVRACGIPCTGVWFSGNGLFPDKTGIRRSSGRLFVKEGRNDGWRDLETNAIDYSSLPADFADPTKLAAGTLGTTPSATRSEFGKRPARVCKRQQYREAI